MQRNRVTRVGWSSALIAAALLCLAGCAANPLLEPARDRAYDFERDSFSFANGVVWERPLLASAGAIPPMPPEFAAEPGYFHRCFPMVLSSRQFFLHARFEPALPQESDETYRRLIRQVVSRPARGDLADEDPVVIPGYANLRAFSRHRESLLKAEIGGPLESYLQLGHWRMVFPFSRDHQQRATRELLQMIRAGRPAIVHLVRFPVVTINHAVLLYDAVETPEEVRFATYDPNNAQQPLVLTYDRASRRFAFPPSRFFRGGRVDVYEIYRRGPF